MGLTWNTQGLWHSRRRRRKPKFAALRKLARGADFVALTDTHSTYGKTLAGSRTSHALDSLPEGFEGHWNH